MSSPGDLRTFAAELRAEADRLQAVLGLAVTLGRASGLDDKIVSLRADATELEDQALALEAARS